MEDLITANYATSMKDLYSGLKTAWRNYEGQVARFTSYKAFYTLAYKTAALAAIDAAQELPDNDARKGTSEILRLGVVDLGKACLQNFQFLKGYIDSAFPTMAVQKIQYVMAGQNNYRDAARGDWESMEAMNSSAKNYLALAANVTALTAGDNMPAAFVATVQAASDAFDAQYDSFKLAEQTSVETANKVKANNAIFKTGMTMLSDAQKIFMNEPEILTKFIFQNILGLINPAVAGIKGTVKELGTNVAIGNALMVAQHDGDVAVTVAVDVDGEFGAQLKEGKYRIVVSADGYVGQEFDMDLKLTGLKRVDIVMERRV